MRTLLASFFLRVPPLQKRLLNLHRTFCGNIRTKEFSPCPLRPATEPSLQWFTAISDQNDDDTGIHSCHHFFLAKVCHVDTAHHLPTALRLYLSAPIMANDQAFRIDRIDTGREHHSAAAIDVNQDGLSDIVTGSAWYAVPFLLKHKVRDAEQIRGCLDDYSCLPLDVGGDGPQALLGQTIAANSVH